MNGLRRILVVSLFYAPLLIAAGRVDEAAQHIQRQEYAEARAILTPLAEAGDPEAQYYLGALHENGWGIGRDLVRAHVFYNRSAAKQHRQTAAARAARDRIESRMSKEELERAESMATGGNVPVEEARVPESPICKELFNAAKMLAAGQKLGAVETNQYTDFGDICEAPTLTIGKSWSYSFCYYGDKPSDSSAVSFCFEGVSDDVIRDAVSSCATGAAGVKTETLTDDGLHFSVGTRRGYLKIGELTYPKRILVRGTWRKFTSCIELYID